MQINEGFRQQPQQPLQLSNERRVREQQKSSFIEILTEPNEKQTEDLVQQIATLLEEQAYIQSSGEGTREYRTRVNTVKMRIKGNRGIFIRKALFTGILSPAELMALDMNKLNEESVQQYLKSVGREWNNKAVSESINSYVPPVLVTQQPNVIVTPKVPPPVPQLVAFPPPVLSNQNPFSEPQLFQIVDQALPDESKNFEQEIEQNFTQEMIQAEHNIDFVEGDEYTWIQLQKDTSNPEENNHLSPLPSSNIINQEFIESESPPLKELSVEHVLTQEIQEQERSYYKVFETLEKDTKYEDEKASMQSQLSEGEENQTKGKNLEKQLDDQDAYEQQLQEQQNKENLQDECEQDQGYQQDQGYEQEYYQEYEQNQEQEQFYQDQQQEYQQQQPDNQNQDQQYFIQEDGQDYQENQQQMDGYYDALSNQQQQPVENNLVNEQITKLELENATLKENSRNQLEQSQQNEKILQQQIEMLQQSNANIYYSNITQQIGELIGQNQKLFSAMMDLKQELNQSAASVLNQIQNHTKQTQKEFQTLNDMVNNLSLDSLNQPKNIQQVNQRSDEKQSTVQKFNVEKANQLTIAAQFQRKTQTILEQPKELWSETSKESLTQYPQELWTQKPQELQTQKPQELQTKKPLEILTQKAQEILTQKPQVIFTEKQVKVLNTGQQQSTEPFLNKATINKAEPVPILTQPHAIPRPSRPAKREQRSQVPGSLFD